MRTERQRGPARRCHRRARPRSPCPGVKCSIGRPIRRTTAPSTRSPASRSRTRSRAPSVGAPSSDRSRTHEGVHPRIGAVDVVPFVPLQGATMAECVELATSTAARVADAFTCRSSFTKTPHRCRAAKPRRVRRGGLDGLATHEARRGVPISADRAAPDRRRHSNRCPADPHGLQREPRDHRLGVAKRIASAIRASGGGPRPLKAMGCSSTPRHRPGVDEPDQLRERRW